MLDQGAAACLCNVGFAAEGLTCKPLDPCASNPCMGGNMSCTVDGFRAICGCKADEVEIAGRCEPRGPCTPNPCTAPHQTVCVVEGAANRCDCEISYSPEDGGCSAQPAWDCTKKHEGDDAFEPDECPMLAKNIELGDAGQTHFLVPAEDDDWIRFGAAEGHVHTVTVFDAQVPVSVDVVRADGVTPVVSDRQGVTSLSLTFVAPASESLLLHVRAARPGDIGKYSVKIEDVGIDDYTNEVSRASPVVLEAPFGGALQYPGDVDVMSLDVVGGNSYRVAFVGTVTPSTIFVEVLGFDAATVITTMLPPPAIRSSVTLHPRTDGRYVFRVRGNPASAMGRFALTTQDFGVDDHGDFEGEATQVPIGAPGRIAKFERSNDLDVFAFPVVAGQYYGFTCELGNAFGTECRVVLRQLNGGVLDDRKGVGLVEANAKAAANGTWTATLSMVGVSPPAVAQYQWQLRDLGPDDYPDVRASASPLTLGTASAGRVQASVDVDWFSFETLAQHAYRVAATCSGCSYQVFDSAGSALTGIFGTLNSFRVTVPGRHYVSVSSSLSGVGYTLKVDDLGLDDHADTPAQATTIVVGATANGDIQFSGDRDLFGVTLTAPRLYQATCIVPSGSCGVQVVDPLLNFAGQTIGSSKTAFFKAELNGRYTVDVSADGPYALTVTDVGLDDAGDTPALARPITVGAPLAAGAFEFRYDVDVFSFATVPSHVYRFVCTTNDGYPCYPVVVRDANTTAVTTVFAQQTSSYGFVATSAGPYTVAVAGSSSPSGYNYRIVDDGTDDYGDTVTTGTPLALSTPLTGSFHAQADVDVFTFAATAGQHLWFRCAAAMSSCFFTVLNPAGTIFTQDNDDVVFRPPTSGTYAFATKASSSASIGPYTVTLTEVFDDHGDTFSAATTLTLGATTGGIIDYPGDTDWFAIDVTPSTSYTVTSTGSSAQLTVFNESGTTQVATGNSPVTFFAGSTATRRYVRVTLSSSATGAYTVRVQ